MGFLPQFIAAAFKTSIQFAGPAVPVPGLAAASEVVLLIAQLCENVSINRRAARRLARGCESMYNALARYEKVRIPDRTVDLRDDVFKSLQFVKDVMQHWASKRWFTMFIHQKEFEDDLEECNSEIANCFQTFITAAQMEGLAWKKEFEDWQLQLGEDRKADHRDLIKALGSMNLKQQAIDDQHAKNPNEMRKAADMLQKALAEEKCATAEERSGMASNLFDLLELSDILPPECQLDAGEVERTSKLPVPGTRHDVDIYEGRYLKRQKVMIKVIRSIKTDDKSVRRLRREIQLWAKIYEVDKGKHILPLYGFCTIDGISPSLVSPWIKNGDSLSYVKEHDRLVNYKFLIKGIAAGIQVLHSMDPPIIHGELKAEKILIGDQGQPLITDFGLAKMAADIEGVPITHTLGISDAYRWYAPEMCSDEGLLSTKSDVYSFAMTILELMLHDKPYARVTRIGQVIKRLTAGTHPDRPNDPRAIERGLNDDMWELLESCWSLQPADRPSIEKVMARL
ncbi:hypothetical protein AX17_003725 [Amanita inopinata Kibby_2008]|nr:hypothetical protein AX17_003725 [Amanita inopinata Kibby_2008]